ncbi:hypothetical protein HDU81_007615 [Chytriomyces hyalinus]|nr:hypothetical protein HDU81_007615 [Chytriomyces hyalinus]
MDCVDEDDFKYPGPAVVASAAAPERRFFRTSASLPRQTRAPALVAKEKLRASEINLALANERAMTAATTGRVPHKSTATMGSAISNDEWFSSRTSNLMFHETPRGSKCGSSAASSNMSTPICRRHSSFQPATLSAEYANRVRPSKCAPHKSSPLASKVQLAESPSPPQQETKNEVSLSNESLFEPLATMKPMRDSLQNLHELLAKRSEGAHEDENASTPSDKTLCTNSPSNKHRTGENVVFPPSNVKLSASADIKKIADSNASISSAQSPDQVVSSDSLTQYTPASSSSLTSKMINMALRSSPSFTPHRNSDAETNNSLPATPGLESYKWNETGPSGSDLDVSGGSSGGNGNWEPKVAKRFTPRVLNSPNSSWDSLAAAKSESNGTKPCKDECGQSEQSEQSDQGSSVCGSSDSMESSRPQGRPKAAHKILKGILKSRRNSSDDGSCSSDRSDSNNALNMGRKRNSLMNSAISLIAGLSNNTAAFGSGSFDAYLAAYHESMVTASHLDQMEMAAAPAPESDDDEAAEPRRISTASRVKWGKSDVKIIQ